MTKKHPARSPRWLGHPRQYQAEAQRLFAIDKQRTILPWSWVETKCEVSLCLDVECMTLHESHKIKYAPGVCVYCGDPAGTRDHLIPAPNSGAALRHRVLTVPACADCNARINDFPSHCVTERREKSHESIRRKYKHLLERPVKTPRQLAELGPTLRTVAVKNNRKTEWLHSRLSWPDDPFYDIRAFQRSGIDDPVALGLVAAIDYRRTA